MKIIKIIFIYHGGMFVVLKTKANKKNSSEKFLIFQEMELSFPRAKALIFSYISGGNLQSRLTNKNQKFLKFL